VPEGSAAGGDGDNTHTNAHKPAPGAGAGAGGTKLRRTSTAGSARDSYTARPYPQKRTAAAARPKIHSNEPDVAEKPTAAWNWWPDASQPRVGPDSGPKVEEIDSSEDTSGGHVAPSTGYRAIPIPAPALATSGNGQAAASHGKPRVNFGPIGSPEGHLSLGMGFVVVRLGSLRCPNPGRQQKGEGGVSRMVRIKHVVLKMASLVSGWLTPVIFRQCRGPIAAEEEPERGVPFAGGWRPRTVANGMPSLQPRAAPGLVRCGSASW
jgi:hypothetical protein